MTEDNKEDFHFYSTPTTPEDFSGLFRSLTQEEETEFRKWARQHKTPEHWKNRLIYHPVVQDEWEKLKFTGQAEALDVYDYNRPLEKKLPKEDWCV